MRGSVQATVLIVVAFAVSLTLFQGSEVRRSEAASSNAKTAVSLCQAGEQAYFTCETSSNHRYISLCGSKDLSNHGGYIQYRFGSKDKIELEFPADKTDSRDKFKYAHYFRAQVDRTEITFENNGYKYTIYDDYEGEQKPVIKESGIRITLPNGQDRKFKCKPDTCTNRMSELQEILPCDKDNGLNMDSCD